MVREGPRTYKAPGFQVNRWNCSVELVTVEKRTWKPNAGRSCHQWTISSKHFEEQLLYVRILRYCTNVFQFITCNIYGRQEKLNWSVFRWNDKH